MSIEEYMNEGTYNWKKHAEFLKDNLRHVVITEFTPSGEESHLYILFEKDGKVYNTNNEVVAPASM